MKRHRVDQSDGGNAPEHLTDPGTARQSTRIVGRPYFFPQRGFPLRVREDEGKDVGIGERLDLPPEGECALDAPLGRTSFGDAATHTASLQYCCGTNDFLVVRRSAERPVRSVTNPRLLVLHVLSCGTGELVTAHSVQ